MAFIAKLLVKDIHHTYACCDEIKLRVHEIQYSISLFGMVYAHAVELNKQITLTQG